MLSSAVLEITVAGIGGFIWLSLLVGTVTGTGGLRGDLLNGWEAIAVIVFGGIVYAIGAIIDRLADTAYAGVRKTRSGKRLLVRLAGEEAAFPERVHVMRLRLMEEDTPRARFLEYQRSRLRIARSVVFNLLLLLPAGATFLALRSDLGWPRITGLGVLLLVAFVASVFATESINRAYESRLLDAYTQWMQQHPGRPRRDDA